MLQRCQIIDRILCFFGPTATGEVANLQRSKLIGGINDYDSVERFLLGLCRWAWLHVDSCERRHRYLEEAAALRVRWPRFVELLWAMDHLSELLKRPYVPDEACLVKLEEIVLQREKYCLQPLAPGDESYRCAKSVREAIVAGSEAANVLHLLTIRRRQQAQYDRALDVSLLHE